MTKAKPQRPAIKRKSSKPKRATIINKPFIDGIQAMMNPAPTVSSEVPPGGSQPNVCTDSQSAELTGTAESTGSSVGGSTETAPAQGAPGRPQGRKNNQRDEVDVSVSRCKGCGSTRRERYDGHPVVQIASGNDVDGNPFTHVVARRTKCKDCGQHRRDISYENHPKLSADQLFNRLVKPKRR